MQWVGMVLVGPVEAIPEAEHLVSAEKVWYTDRASGLRNFSCGPDSQ